MSDHVKISSAFDAFVADSGRNEECDALVIFRAPRDGSLPWRSKNPSDRNHVTARAERERTVYVSVTDASHLEELRRLFKRVELTLPLAAGPVSCSPGKTTRRLLSLTS